ncbi:MAG: sensor histidine kinase [Gammaproteobacteria bacterium]|nr:sensor histidine kinase [Gammaproteobacteria bacterium]
MLNSLSLRLPAALVLLFLVIGIAMVLLTRVSADRYYQEITQRLNAPVAMYVAGEAPLIRDGAVNATALQSLAHKAMVINPSVEVYLLDADGRILAHDLGTETPLRSAVALVPVQRFLADGNALPLFGDDPRSEQGRKIFSAAEVRHAGRLEGYVYIVLGGQKYTALAASAEASEALRLSTLAVIGCLLFGLASALLIFARLSRRLRRLTQRVNAYCAQTIDNGEHVSRVRGDEISQLSRAFDAMQGRIDEQMAQLRDADHQRRELVAHVSHDLRTPLATMRGYIETLTLKQGALDPDEQRRYLGIVHQHTRRLGRLIDDLFELARLDAGLIEPERTTFCVAELASDIVQEFRLDADRQGVSLTIERGPADASVYADIRLTERVITNLLSNAVRHTPSGGRVSVLIDDGGDDVAVQVTDSGSGIAAQDLPRVFDRGFRAAAPVTRQPASSGLGLAIVRRILALHDSEIDVHSAPGKGAAFRFTLPRALPQRHSRGG